jgi:two-component system, NtrC family, response regulator
MVMLLDPEFTMRAEARARTRPVEDDGRFGRLALLLPSGQRRALGRALTLGSGDDCDVCLFDPCVSRRHCEIAAADGRVVVRDLGSTNGTWVNGVRVPHAELRPGAVLTLGDTRLRVIVDERSAEIVGESSGMQKLRLDIARLAAVPLPVLICGETGTGKELVARALHDQSGRRGEFVPVNCGSIPKELIETELFGHERGAFTGAHARRPGLFQQADGGTLFLDEIGELPEGLQTRLLRTLESGVVRPVGATREATVNVRVVAATHVNLEQAVADGRFRRDLYYRLAAAVITTPALRARRSDIPLLIERILQDEAAGGARCQLSGAAMAAMMEHSWPGNVRELKNVLKRAAALGGALLEPSDLSFNTPPVKEDEDVVKLQGQTFEQIEREVLIRAVKRCGGNQRAASEELGIPRSTLNDKIRRYGVEPPAAARRRRD